MEKQEPQFSRKATAKVLEVSPDSLKDWSSGKPWLLRPSVSAMGKGSRTIYSIFDVYLGAVALALNLGGMSCKKIAAVLPGIASNPEWLRQRLEEFFVFTVWRHKVRAWNMRRATRTTQSQSSSISAMAAPCART